LHAHTYSTSANMGCNSSQAVVVATRNSIAEARPSEKTKGAVEGPIATVDDCYANVDARSVAKLEPMVRIDERKLEETTCEPTEATLQPCKDGGEEEFPATANADMPDCKKLASLFGGTRGIQQYPLLKNQHVAISKLATETKTEDAIQLGDALVKKRSKRPKTKIEKSGNDKSRKVRKR